ncbi:MAG: formylglycine-generating enzyme family protein [Bacteroidales bacterium]|nr:formylglycine-generating enzyme family protein [Bacteroidales bacterium]
MKNLTDMKHILFTLTFIFCVTVSFAQELKVKSFTYDAMNLEARLDGGRTDLNGRQCALVKVMVRDNIVKCKGGNVGDVITEGVVKKIFVSPSARYLELEFQYSFPIRVTFSEYGYEKLTEGGTYTVSLIDANMLTQQELQELMKKAAQRQNVVQAAPVSTGTDSAYVEVTDTVAVDSVAVEEEIIIAADIISDDKYTVYNKLPITVEGIVFNMIKVDGGTFMMGASEETDNYSWEREHPAHQVALSSYYIGETEVTQALWKAVMGKNPSKTKGDDLPVERVSWYDCQKFIEKLNSLTGKKFRLPTEAEWEFAARGGNKNRHTQYSGSKRINDVAWYWQNSGDMNLSGQWDGEKIKRNNCKIHPVKTKMPNELGIYDMSGNVCEWCHDWYGAYSSNAQTNPTGPESGTNRVFRGGSWNVVATCCRTSIRLDGTPNYRENFVGLRLALSE